MRRPYSFHLSDMLQVFIRLGPSNLHWFKAFTSLSSCAPKTPAIIHVSLVQMPRHFSTTA